MSIVKATEIAGAEPYPSRRLNMRERKILQVSDQYVATTPTDWPAGAPTSVSAAVDQLASGNARGQLVKVTYDFSVNGGAIGDIPLALTLPNKAVAVKVGYWVLTSFTSAGAATISAKLGAEPSGTIIGGTPIAIASLTSGSHANGDVTDFGSAIKTTAARIVTLTVHAFALTAGKADIFVEYILGT